MDHTQLKEILYQRIEVAGPELLQRMFELSEGYADRHGSSQVGMVREEPQEPYTATALTLPRMTREEANADIAQGLLDYKEGRYVDFETFRKELRSW